MPDKSHIRKRGFLLTSGSKVHSFKDTLPSKKVVAPGA